MKTQIEVYFPTNFQILCLDLDETALNFYIPVYVFYVYKINMLLKISKLPAI